jgi:hypothetical protein
MLARRPVCTARNRHDPAAGMPRRSFVAAIRRLKDLMDTLLAHQIWATDRAGQLPPPLKRTRAKFAQVAPVHSRPDQRVILASGTRPARIVATGEAANG